jgi:hypothetical protein
MENVPVDCIVARLVNKRRQTYFVKVRTMNPAQLVRGLWEMIDPHCSAHDDDYFSGELTDQGRCFRTSVSRSFHRGWDVCIRTHGWSPSSDTDDLHSEVLTYLRGRGLSV